MSSSPLSWIYRSSTVIHRPILYSHRMMIGALPWSLRHEYHDWWRSDPYPFDEQQSIRITTSNLHRSSSLLLYITYSSNDCIGHHPDILYQLSPSSLSLWVSTLDLNGCIPTRRIRQAQKKAGLLPSSLSGYETGDSNLSDRRRYCRLSCVYGECVEYHEIRSCHNLVDGETNLYLIWTCPQPNHASNDDWTDIVSIQFPSLDTNLIYRNGKLYCGHHKTLSLSPMLYREQYGPHLLLTDFTHFAAFIR
uniref:Uncharacterized protein n=1 Tax=Spongospora subterranea TaxID=70186 RepID=A0A0H5QLG5_9EUKA|eukprot:CRZ02838.1 hypothetical protein [Spongospora subterranea]